MICDDMLSELSNNSFIMALFTRLSHHYNLSTILMLQNHTIAGKSSGVLNKNVHYNLLLRSPRDSYSLRSIGMQLNDYKNLMTAYKDATLEQYSYLLIDSHPKSDPNIRYKTKIFPTDQFCIVYS